MDVQDCQGSRENVDRARGSADKYDLVVVIGEILLKRAVDLNINKPVIYAMAYNQAELLDRKRNITGASLNIAAALHLAAIKRALPNIRSIGVVSSQTALISGVKQSPGANGLVIIGIVVPRNK